MRDQDTIRRFDLLELSAEDYVIILKCGVLIALLSYVVAIFVAATTGTESSLLVSVPPVVGALYSLWMVWAAHRRLTPDQRARLTRQRDLIARQRRLRAAAEEATADREEALAQMARLGDLLARMERFHAELLAGRIEELRAAIRSLDDRTHTDRHLVNRYERECQLLGVEIDALDLFTGEVQAALQARLEELEAIEEEIEASERLRGAALELARYLGEVAA